ncbi:MAG: hypothetical protein COT17_08120 [Elusimicrobia bacterium CG08_land_8_20_14_0_20_51_18]|nr:MAG: hypothetical protein COT17_08120 [Elusimicrobia bacterium CG08_land_8_20_14_0_20_51_18]
MKIKIISLFVLVFAGASFSAPPPEPGEITQFFDTKTKSYITPDQLQERLEAADALYIGESHDQAECHIAQLKAIMGLNEVRQGKVAVGFEMLNSTLQPILDEYAEGKISDEEFLEKANWKKEWGFDFKLYEPIFSYIRRNKLKALALNVPRKIVSKTARGGLKALTEEEKKLTAKKVKINKDKKYVAYLRETYGGHGDNPMNRIMTFDNYLASMAVWNESMAEKAADFLNANKGWAFAVVAGNGHVQYNAAIPWSVKKRTKKLNHLSIYTEDLANRASFVRNPEPLADIIWFVPFEKKAEPKVEVSTAAPAMPSMPAKTETPPGSEK